MARADTRRWCGPRREAGLYTRIAAVAGPRPPGPAGRGQPDRPGRRLGGRRTRNPLAARPLSGKTRAQSLPAMITGGCKWLANYPGQAAPATAVKARPNLFARRADRRMPAIPPKRGGGMRGNRMSDTVRVGPPAPSGRDLPGRPPSRRMP